MKFLMWSNIGNQNLFYFLLESDEFQFLFLKFVMNFKLLSLVEPITFSWGENLV